MFTINEDLSIYATRGDIVHIKVEAVSEGEKYKFQAGDIVRFKVFGKKDCAEVVFVKDFPITAETEIVEIFLTGNETRIGGVINKPSDYWYEVELNPETNPQTIIGYDEEGAKVFRLFPEGRNLSSDDPDITPEDIPIIDVELDLTSKRPVENQAIARGIANSATQVKNELYNKIDETSGRLDDKIDETSDLFDKKINTVSTAINNKIDKSESDLIEAIERLNEKFNNSIRLYVANSYFDTHPHSLFGGEWEVIDKGFRNESGTYTFDEKRDDNCLYCGDLGTSANAEFLKKAVVHYQRSSQVLRLRIELYFKEGGLEFSDQPNDNLALIYFFFKDFGVHNIFKGFADMAVFNDACNANGLLINLTTGGVLEQADVINGTHTKFTYSGAAEPFTVDVTIPTEHQQMVNQFCDKIYWKRID